MDGPDYADDHVDGHAEDYAENHADHAENSAGRRGPGYWDVIVVGAGFAGAAVAQRLGRAGVGVLLVDANDYHQFQPLLYQVATSQIGISQVARPLRTMFRRYGTVRVVVSEVMAIDAGAKTVTLDDGTVCSCGHLVIATGAQPN